MSDGPHRSLSMHRAWQEVSKRADQSTYTPQDVCDAMPDALAGAWRNEVSARLITALKNIFLGKANSLRLPELAQTQLDAAETLAAGSAFGRNAVAWSRLLIKEGNWGEPGLLKAVGNAALERATSGILQVEEHYLRESSNSRASNVRNRLSEAVSNLSADSLGDKLINRAPSSSRKKENVDDGVLLP